MNAVMAIIGGIVEENNLEDAFLSFADDSSTEDKLLNSGCASPQSKDSS